MVFLWCFGFGKYCETSPRSNHYAERRWLLYKIHFSSHITMRSRNGLLLRERSVYFIMTKFLTFIQYSYGTHLSSFFDFPSYLRWTRAVGWFTSNFTASESLYTDLPSPTTLIRRCQLPIDVHDLLYLQALASISKFLKTLHRSFVVPWPNALLMLPVASATRMSLAIASFPSWIL